MSGADIARAILRARYGPRRGHVAETAPVGCSWCGAAAHRPCRAPGVEAPLSSIHDRRRREAAAREETP